RARNAKPSPAPAPTKGSGERPCHIRSRAALAREAGSSARALRSRKVVASDFFMRGGARVDFGDQAAERQKVSAVGYAERERRLLLHEHNGKPFLVEKRQRAENLVDDLGAEPERGLVEQQYLR